MVDWNGDGKVDIEEEVLTAGLIKGQTGNGRGSCGCCLLPCVLLVGMGILGGAGIYKIIKNVRK